MKRGLMLACTLAFGLAACHDHGDHLLQGGGGGGSADTEFSAVNKNANLALTSTPKDVTLTTLDTADFQGFALEKADSQYAGFALAVSTPTAPPAKVLYSYPTKSAQTSGATLLDNVKTDLSSDGTLDTFNIGFQNSFSGLGGSQVFTSRVTITITAPVGVSDLRNRIAVVVTGKGSASALPGTVTSQASAYTFSLTVIEVNGRTIVTFGLAPQAVFPSLPPDVGDFDDGKTVTEATSELKSNSDTFTAKAAGAADILLLVDNSGSMSSKQENLAKGIDQFISIIDAAGIDYHVGVARTGPDFSGTQLPCADLAPISTGARFVTPSTVNGLAELKTIATPGSDGSGNETGLFCAEQAFYVDPHQTNTGFDRPTAKDVVLFLSDEGDQEVEDSSRPDDAPTDYVLRDVAAYTTIFQNHNAAAFAIVGPGTLIPETFDETQTCGENGGASGGAAYGAVATATGGSRTSTCTDAADWIPTLQAAGLAASGGASQFILSFIPDVSSVQVTINGTAVTRDSTRKNGFDVAINADTATIIFFGNARPKTGDKVAVTYAFVPPPP